MNDERKKKGTMMKVNSAKQKMLGGEAAFGYSAKLGSPVAAELLSQSGADFVLLDGQHGCWGPEAMVAGITAVCAGAAVPMARVSFNTYTLIGQLLDAGLLGIIIPMVNTVEEARAAAAACRYPPVGERSFGWGRAMSYARPSFSCNSNIKFNICACTETSSAETGSSATTRRGLSASARAMPMRCRCPPLNACG